jgi:arsenate reductase (thioredoxin)
MAEGLAKQLKSHAYEFYSAGTKKQGINPRAAEVMKELGIDLNSQYSKTTEELPNVNMDFIFTVCSDAHENCPYFPGGKIINRGFDDPPRLTANMANEEEILKVYRRVRDEIKAFILEMERILEES